MSGTASGSLRRVLLPGERISSLLFAFNVKSHGAALKLFGALIRRFPVEAAAELQILEDALTAAVRSGGHATVGDAWAASRRLMDLARKLPILEQEAIGLQLERGMQTLVAREGEFARLFDDGVAETMLEMGGGKGFKPLFETPVSSEAPKTGAVLAELGSDLNAARADAELLKLWNHFNGVVGPTSKWMRSAAKVAADQAADVQKLLKQGGPKATQALWGHLSNVRSVLGEGYALENQIWLSEAQSELVRARQTALELGPGHSVGYFTQAEHGVLLNGRSGPDAIVAILNKRQGWIHVPTRTQVKIATISEGAEQTINDTFRSAGLEKQASGTAHYTLTLGRGAAPRTFLLVFDPRVEERFYIINAARSRMPAAQRDLLSRLMAVDELQLDLSVRQFTHLTLSVMEAALKAAKKIR